MRLRATDTTPRQLRSSLPSLLVVSLLLVGGPAASAPAEPAARPPNIVLIIGDDHGYPDFGFTGSPNVETPRLDRLASESMFLRNGYSTASHCAPALRSLLTGLHPEQWDHVVTLAERQRGEPIPMGRQVTLFETLPAQLTAGGYATFMGGKFWEDGYELAGFTHGTDPPPSKSGEKMPVPLGRTTMQPVYDFIDAHSNASTDADGTQADEGREAHAPFFLWFAPKLPHAPFDARKRYRRPYGRRGFSDEAVAYYANIARFDEVVGQLLDHLDARGLRDDTLVVYVADNGWDQGPHSVPVQVPPSSWDGPKGKRTMHDLGFRTPILLRWPGHLEAGAVSEALVSIVDLVPTLRSYAGLPTDGSLPGEDLRPMIEGRSDWGRSRIFGSMRRPRAGAQSAAAPETRRPNRAETAYFVRTKRWHYIWYPVSAEEELYEVRIDPNEEKDLSTERKGLCERFRREIEQWQRKMRTAAVGPPKDAPRVSQRD